MAADVKVPELKPCPFCGGTDLRGAQWTDKEGNEVPAIECHDCLAGAIRSTWNKRSGGAQ
jgi:hypothetical protein